MRLGDMRRSTNRDPDRAYMVMMNHEINVLNYV